MTKNLYYIQTNDGQGYRRCTREQVNKLIESGLAEWVGTDGEEHSFIVRHYADRTNTCETFNVARQGMCKRQLTPLGDCRDSADHGDEFTERSKS